MSLRAMAIGGVMLCGVSLQAEAIPFNLGYLAEVNAPVMLQAGTYEIAPKGTADGYLYDGVNFWGFTAGCNPSGTNCTNGWLWYLTLQDAPGAPAIEILHYDTTDDPGDNGRYATAAGALAEAKSDGPFQFSVASDVTYYFHFADSVYTDNLGGISFELTRVTPNQSIPEPATLALLGIGLAGLGFSRRKRRI